MGKPAARIGDMHMCPMVTPGMPPVPHVGGPITGPGCPTVLIGGMPAAVMGDMCTCVGPPDTIVLGSTGVFIGGKPAARMGDQCVHGGKVVIGMPTVLIGEVSSGGGGASGGGTSSNAASATANKAKATATNAFNTALHTMPPDIAVKAAQIVTLIEAAADGMPFCERIITEKKSLPTKEEMAIQASHILNTLPYSARRMRAMLEEKNDIVSTTIPPSDHHMLRKVAVDIGDGRSVGFDERGLPDFSPFSVTSARIQQSFYDNLSTKNPRRIIELEKSEATRQVKAALKKGEYFGVKFTQEQRDAINSERPTIPGYRWHHVSGRELQLVPEEIHRKVGHIGSSTMRYGR